MTTQREPDNWRKSSRSSDNPDCVEVANNEALALLRDTKDRLGGRLAFSASSWSAFTDVVKSAN